MKKIFLLNDLRTLLALSFLISLSSCNRHGDEADAYGNFEADEIIVSAQSQGELVYLGIDEGDTVIKGALVGRIDSVTPTIKKEQLLAQQKVIQARLINLDKQLNVQHEQRINLVREYDRIEKLFKEGAATQQQFDDISGKLKVLDSQTDAMESQKNIIHGEMSVLLGQLDEVNNLIEKCRIISPISGTVLEKYVEAGELVSPGKSIFKIADVSEMELKVYISGSQLSSVKTGDTVVVKIDGPSESLQTIKGVVTWIASRVEFTPKIIQTREERVNMVYGVKVRVKNDGRLKIGMPGEVDFVK